MFRAVTQAEPNPIIIFDGRTELAGLSRFKAFRDRTGNLRRFIVRHATEGREIGELHCMGPDASGKALYHLTASLRDGRPVFIVGCELQPNLFGLYLRPEDQACMDHLNACPA